MNDSSEIDLVSIAIVFQHCCRCASVRVGDDDQPITRTDKR